MIQNIHSIVMSKAFFKNKIELRRRGKLIFDIAFSTRYCTLLRTREEKQKENINLGEFDCRIINNLFIEELCNTARNFYLPVFIFSRPKQ